MNLDKVIATLVLLGSDLPAFKALFDQVKATFSETDQATLQKSYEDAMMASDAAHKAAQDI